MDCQSQLLKKDEASVQGLPDAHKHVRVKPVSERAASYNSPDLEKLTKPLSDAGYRFLESRGFSREVIGQNNIRTAIKRFQIDGQPHYLECIAIPSMKDGECVSIKYRSIVGAN
jgi:hypothetical protein